jgi:2-polyprenyl-3-methyl-5-hydroxy-6-metoxy-1,4-benzoquinol methylase
MKEFEPHEVIWTEEKVNRFWDWLGTSPALQATYFSRRVGDSLLNQVSRRIPLNGLIMDYGAGPGFLVEKLLARGKYTIALDTSEASLDVLRTRYGKSPFFKGAYSINEPLIELDGSADVVFLIEVVEHVDNDILANILQRIQKLLKTGGHIVISTPYHENLPDNQIMCPDCGAIFHTVQHIRAFTADNLENILRNAGYETIFCRPVLFSKWPMWLHPLQLLKRKLTKEELPHLMFIGRKV